MRKTNFALVQEDFIVIWKRNKTFRTGTIRGWCHRLVAKQHKVVDGSDKPVDAMPRSQKSACYVMSANVYTAPGTHSVRSTSPSVSTPSSVYGGAQLIRSKHQCEE